MSCLVLIVVLAPSVVKSVHSIRSQRGYKRYTCICRSGGGGSVLVTQIKSGPALCVWRHGTIPGNYITEFNGEERVRG